jgi:hypothetical protein
MYLRAGTVFFLAGRFGADVEIIWCIILIYLLHLSVVSSKSHHSINTLTQEIALLKEKMEKAEKEKTGIN